MPIIIIKKKKNYLYICETLAYKSKYIVLPSIDCLKNEKKNQTAAYCYFKIRNCAQKNLQKSEHLCE